MFTRRLLIDSGGTTHKPVPPLPDVDTNLWSTTEADEDGFYDTFDVVIPAGVNVVYVGGRNKRQYSWRALLLQYVFKL